MRRPRLYYANAEGGTDLSAFYLLWLFYTQGYMNALQRVDN